MSGTFYTKQIKRRYEPETGERLWFSISNNGKKWNDVSPESVKLAVQFFDDCIASVERMRSELLKLKG